MRSMRLLKRMVFQGLSVVLSKKNLMWEQKKMSMSAKNYVSRHANVNGVQFGNKMSGFAGGVGTSSSMNRLYRSKAHVSTEDQTKVFSIDPNAGGVGRGRGVFGGSGFPKMDGVIRRSPYQYGSTETPVTIPIVPTVPTVITTPLVSAISTDHDYWAGLFSLKLLCSDYEGPVITLRRGSDNTRMSFYSTAAGVLTSNADGTGTSVATFLDSTTGFVDTWHDQSRNGNDAVQTVTTLQPSIDLTNNCLDFGFNTGTGTGICLTMPSNTIPVDSLNAPYSFVVKHGNTKNTNGAFLGAGNWTFNRSNTLRFNGALGSYRNYWFSNDYVFAAANTFPAVAGVSYDANNRHAGYRDGILRSLYSNRTGVLTSAGIQYIGRGPSPTLEFLNGQIYSILIFHTDLPESDMKILSAL